MPPTVPPQVYTETLLKKEAYPGVTTNLQNAFMYITAHSPYGAME